MKADTQKTLAIEVKYRMKENGQPKLKEQKGYADLQLSNISFQSSSISNDLMGYYILMDYYNNDNTLITDLLKIQYSLLDEINRLK